MIIRTRRRHIRYERVSAFAVVYHFLLLLTGVHYTCPCERSRQRVYPFFGSCLPGPGGQEGGAGSSDVDVLKLKHIVHSPTPYVNKWLVRNFFKSKNTTFPKTEKYTKTNRGTAIGHWSV